MADTVSLAKSANWTAGKADLKSATALGFAPEGVLLVGDSTAGKVYALDTGDTAQGAPGKLEITDLTGKIAALLGTSADQIRVPDVAVNPLSGNVYIAVARGAGADADALILKADRAGKLSELSLSNIRYLSVDLTSTVDHDAKDQRGNPTRGDTVTDIGFVDGKVIVAGLSNEEFASTLRAINFPFDGKCQGAGIEIYHGAHGRYETNAPIRTFMRYVVDGKESILASYTCTPLVKIPVSDLQPGAKVKGTTIAELGNMNRPLDMIAYEKGGHKYILMANSNRGVMKLDADNLEQYHEITDRVPATKGVPYETIAGLEGVRRLDKVDDQSALVMISADDKLSLQTIALP